MDIGTGLWATMSRKTPSVVFFFADAYFAPDIYCISYFCTWFSGKC